MQKRIEITHSDSSYFPYTARLQRKWPIFGWANWMSHPQYLAVGKTPEDAEQRLRDAVDKFDPIYKEW